MEVYGQNFGGTGSVSGSPVEWVGVEVETGIEESMRRLGLLSRELYPERLGVADCAYYMRTGSCAYGSKCRYHHPRDRSLAGGTVRAAGGEYPERIGEPECQYYLKTGTCKFGASCKFHHPQNRGGSSSVVPVNINGYPLRPGEKECSYYLKTGHCRFHLTCKFHHPHLGNISTSVSLGPFYSTAQSLAPSREQFGGVSTSYSASKPPLVPGSYVSGAYGPLLPSPGMVPIPNWSRYAGPGSPVMSPSAQPSVEAASLYGMAQSSNPGFAGPYAPAFPPTGSLSDNRTIQVFPERPGQPECQYYMKTGDCKYGSSCKYHHPPDWVVPKTNCVLSNMGLPLRPGVQSCSFYLQNGHCKFGQTCKFDHPVETGFNPSFPSLSDATVAPYMFPSSPATITPVEFSELQPKFISGSNLDS